NIMGTHFLSKKKYRPAIEQFNRALTSHSRHTDSWTKRGIARYALGEKKLAILDWEAACRIQPSLRRLLGNLIRKARDQP
ncbi:MAG: hypothetical protein QF645_11765, partial [Planctomycetota bacterium]|nr:hypothetical protein [Planctomycetota bacterium]